VTERSASAVAIPVALKNERRNQTKLFFATANRKAISNAGVNIRENGTTDAMTKLGIRVGIASTDAKSAVEEPVLAKWSLPHGRD
jgi:hypothetical protein